MATSRGGDRPITLISKVGYQLNSIATSPGVCPAAWCNATGQVPVDGEGSKCAKHFLVKKRDKVYLSLNWLAGFF